MTAVVREADLDADGPLIVEFLRTNHTPESTPQRFEWLYCRGPAGEARAWILFDDKKDGVATGVAAAFPRRLYANGHEVCGWVLGDFCVDPKCRSLGPAALLQKTCMMQLQKTSSGIYYDFPSLAMTAVYRRLGVPVTQQIVRFVKPLRADTRVRKLIRQRRLATAVTTVVNHGLSALTRKTGAVDGQLTTLRNTPCGDEFTNLADEVGSGLGICVQRSAKYLNWRFQEHPYRRYEIITQKKLTELTGYAVIREEGSYLNIVDLFGCPDSVPDLVRAAISIANDRKLEAVAAGILDSHPWKGILRELGFFAREKLPVVTHFPSPAVQTDDSSWYLSDGDRES